MVLAISTGEIDILVTAVLGYVITTFLFLKVKKCHRYEIELQEIVDEQTMQLSEKIEEMKEAKNVLEERTQELEELNKKLELLSTLDGLTGITNRRRFDKILELNWRRAKRLNTPQSLVMIDIDFFKNYNDYYGHQAGDECLKSISRTLGLAARRAGDTVARYGGEEFVILLVDTHLEGAKLVAEKIRNAVLRLRIPHEASKVAPFVTVSIGVATLIPNKKNGYTELVSLADKALYRAKAEGRNRIAIARTAKRIEAE